MMDHGEQMIVSILMILVPSLLTSSGISLMASTSDLGLHCFARLCSTLFVMSFIIFMLEAIGYRWGIAIACLAALFGMVFILVCGDLIQSRCIMYLGSDKETGQKVHEPVGNWTNSTSETIGHAIGEPIVEFFMIIYMLPDWRVI